MKQIAEIIDPEQEVFGSRPFRSLEEEIKEFKGFREGVYPLENKRLLKGNMNLNCC